MADFGRYAAPSEDRSAILSAQVLDPVETHTALMHDEVRVSAYKRAIAATVKSGDVVLDLGAGTGVMGLLACRAGAARVYSIEAGGMVEILRQIVRDNRLEDRVVCLHGDSTRVELPERVDVVIADQAGPFGIGGGLFKAFNDAHRRFFKPQARTIPSRIELSIALAEFPGGTDLSVFGTSGSSVST
jgi:protein arginine N-methyltransferase 1